MKRYILLLLMLFETFQKSDVYFTKEITSEKIVEMFKKLNVKLEGKVGLKVHSGEKDGPYFLRPHFLEKIYEYTKGTFIECNTAYDGYRNSTKAHKELLGWNGWTKYNTVIMDEDDGNFTLKVEKPNNISVNYVGSKLKDFDSCLVLAHFKGHPMGGFGGAMKQLSIGFASTAGKSYIHSGGYTLDYNECWDIHEAEQLDFTAAMADAASTIVKYFKDRGGIAYINVLVNISEICDCGGILAPPPKIRDIGILASTDPIAIDKACYDLIVKENTSGSKDWVNQSERLLGLNTLVVGEKIGLGSLEYNLIDVDEEDKEDKEDLWYVWYLILPIGILIIITIIALIIYFYKKKGKKEKTEGETDDFGEAMISKAE